MTDTMISAKDIRYDNDAKDILFGSSKKATFKAILTGNRRVLLRPLLKTMKNINVALVQQVVIHEMENIKRELEYDRLVKVYGCIVENLTSVEERLSPGMSLQEYLMDGPVLSWKGRYIIGYDISQAMRYLHSSGTTHGSKPIRIHQKLSSASIVLVQEERRLRAKVAEVGLQGKSSCFIFTEELAIRETILDLHQIKNWKSYMDARSLYDAPEIYASGLPIYTKETDVYSYGLILLELALFQVMKPNTVSEFGNLSAEESELKMPNVVHSLIDSCIDLNSANRPSFHLVSMYFKENRKDIQHHPLERELQQQLLDDQLNIYDDEEERCQDRTINAELPISSGNRASGRSHTNQCVTC